MAVCRIFDAHFHVGAYGIQTVNQRPIRPIMPEWDEPGSCSKYLDRHALEGGVIVPTYLDDQTAAFHYNNQLLDQLAYDDRLIGGLWVSPLEAVRPLCDAALNLLPHPRIRALKIASNTWAPFSIDPATWNRSIRMQMERILETARHYELVIHCHTGYLPGSEPMDFDAFMRTYGHKATFQLVHMGEAIAPVFAFVPRFIDWIESGMQVYTDTSLVPGFGPPWLLETLDRHNLGFSRVLFATDTPWGRYPAERAKLDMPDVPSDVLSALLWHNAAALYNLE